MNVNLIKILASTEQGGILPGNAEYDFGGAALTTLVSIIIVFGVLLIIIGATHVLFWTINKIKDAIDKSNSKFARFFKRKNANDKKAGSPAAPAKVEIVDDDMMAAVLAATIDYQAEVKSDVRLVSVKEIK